MKIVNCKLGIIAILSIAVLLLSLSPIHAQPLSLSLYPPLLEVMMQPGKSITQVYKISNDGYTDLVMGTVVVPFQPADELGNISLNNSQMESLPFLSWFYFQNADLSLGQKFTLKAGKTQSIVLKIKIPENAPEDDYYVTFLFQTVPPETPSQDLVNLAQAKIGGNILLTVSKTGEPTKQAKIGRFSLANFPARHASLQGVAGRLFSIFGLYLIDSFDSPQYILRLENIGKTVFKPQGTISTTGWGQKYILNLLPENVLANSQRLISCQEISTSTTNYGPCILKKKFLLGIFKTKVGFGLDKPEEQYSQEFIFLALPFKLFLGILVAAFSLFIVKKRTNYHLTRGEKAPKN